MTKTNKPPHFERYVGNFANEPTNQLTPLVAKFDQQLQDVLLFNTDDKNPKDIIDHCRKQLQIANESGPLTGNWVTLEEIVKLAETALLNNDRDKLGFSMYWLGQKAEFLTHWHDSEDFKKSTRTRSINHARLKGLQSKSHAQRWLKEFCQEIATLIWSNDTEQRAVPHP